MRRDAVASQVSRNAAGEFGKPPFGSRIPASRGVEVPRRCFGIAIGPSPAEKPGYGIVWVPYVGFYPLARIPIARDSGASQPGGARINKRVAFPPQNVFNQPVEQRALSTVKQRSCRESSDQASISEREICAKRGKVEVPLWVAVIAVHRGTRNFGSSGDERLLCSRVDSPLKRLARTREYYQ
jgi:hypothetical protein